jgi:hypothetical protein
MSSDRNNELVYEYPAGAIADSPVPFSQEHPINTPVAVQSPVPICYGWSAVMCDVHVSGVILKSTTNSGGLP